MRAAPAYACPCVSESSVVWVGTLLIIYVCLCSKDKQMRHPLNPPFVKVERE